MQIGLCESWQLRAGAPSLLYTWQTLTRTHKLTTHTSYWTNRLQLAPCVPVSVLFHCLFSSTPLPFCSVTGGGGVRAPYFVAMDTTNTQDRKILHRIISGQLRLFALLQTSGLEAFSCQRHKLFLCLHRSKGVEVVVGVQIWKEHTNAVRWQVSPCLVRWEGLRTVEGEERMLIKGNSGAQGNLGKWRRAWRRKAEKDETHHFKSS